MVFQKRDLLLQKKNMNSSPAVNEFSSSIRVKMKIFITLINEKNNVFFF